MDFLTTSTSQIFMLKAPGMKYFLILFWAFCVYKLCIYPVIGVKVRIDEINFKNCCIQCLTSAHGMVFTFSMMHDFLVIWG